ncbi:MAG: hypothetical protein RLO18_31575, partial [Gimesia chilikensis]
ENILFDGGDGFFSTGISTKSVLLTSGKAGNIFVEAGHLLNIVNGAEISSTTSSKKDAGNIFIKANAVELDGQGANRETRVASSAVSGSSGGNAGEITFEVQDQISVVNSATIASLTEESGDAGSISITTGSLLLDGQGSELLTGCTTQANTESSAKSGIVKIQARDLVSVLNGAQISSSTFAAGDAGGISLNAANLLVDDQGSEFFTLITSSSQAGSTGNAGTVELSISDELTILNGGQVITATWASGDAGEIRVDAGNVVIAGQAADKRTVIASATVAGSTGNSGSVVLTVDDQLSLLSGGEITTSTGGTGN